jgi:hypothetical protein
MRASRSGVGAQAAARAVTHLSRMRTRRLGCVGAGHSWPLGAGAGGNGHPVRAHYPVPRRQNRRRQRTVRTIRDRSPRRRPAWGTAQSRAGTRRLGCGTQATRTLCGPRPVGRATRCVAAKTGRQRASGVGRPDGGPRQDGSARAGPAAEARQPATARPGRPEGDGRPGPTLCTPEGAPTQALWPDRRRG